MVKRVEVLHCIPLNTDMKNVIHFFELIQNAFYDNTETVVELHKRSGLLPHFTK